MPSSGWGTRPLPDKDLFFLPRNVGMAILHQHLPWQPSLTEMKGRVIKTTPELLLQKKSL